MLQALPQKRAKEALASHEFVAVMDTGLGLGCGGGEGRCSISLECLRHIRDPGDSAAGLAASFALVLRLLDSDRREGFDNASPRCHAICLQCSHKAHHCKARPVLESTCNILHTSN